MTRKASAALAVSALALGACGGSTNDEGLGEEEATREAITGFDRDYDNEDDALSISRTEAAARGEAWCVTIHYEITATGEELNPAFYNVKQDAAGIVRAIATVSC